MMVPGSVCGARARNDESELDLSFSARADESNLSQINQGATKISRGAHHDLLPACFQFHCADPRLPVVIPGAGTLDSHGQIPVPGLKRERVSRRAIFAGPVQMDG